MCRLVLASAPTSGPAKSTSFLVDGHFVCTGCVHRFGLCTDRLLYSPDQEVGRWGKNEVENMVSNETPVHPHWLAGWHDPRFQKAGAP